ncbi:UNVERIFIED_CONTAM: hypothetical protein NCL1_40568 [Trichonephila clavipes]
MIEYWVANIETLRGTDITKGIATAGSVVSMLIAIALCMVSLIYVAFAAPTHQPSTQSQSTYFKRYTSALGDVLILKYYE